MVKNIFNTFNNILSYEQKIILKLHSLILFRIIFSFKVTKYVNICIHQEITKNIRVFFRYPQFHYF